MLKELHAMKGVYEMFQSKIGKDNLMEWSSESYAGYNSMAFWNRYFTPIKPDSGIQSIPFSQYTDPDGYLAQVLQSEPKLAHLMENETEYYVYNSDINRCCVNIYVYLIYIYLFTATQKQDHPHSNQETL